MGRVACALAAALIAGLAFSQEGPRYASAENPFQAEYGFTLGQPLGLRVDVLGVRLDTVEVLALQGVRAGEKIKCEVQVKGSSVAEKKATLTTVLLLEDPDGKGLERISLAPFKAKPGKPFDERQKVLVGGDALAAAAKVYFFLQVTF